MALTSQDDRHETARPAAMKVSQSQQIELPIDRISGYPMLEACLCHWIERCSDNRLPASMDTDVLPRDVLDYTMLLDYLPDNRDAWVRMVGMYIGERAIFSAEGLTLRGFFQASDAEMVYRSLDQIAEDRQPSLAKRTHVLIDGRNMSYTRLILPMSYDGSAVTGFFKTIEPSSLQEEMTGRVLSPR